MKEFTIITPPEYEALVLEAIGRIGAAQLKEVTGEFESPPRLNGEFRERAR